MGGVLENFTINCMFVSSMSMSWNVILRNLFVSCRNCVDLKGFLMNVGDIDEHIIVSCQRSFTIDTWERTLCDFLWACSQWKKGRNEWSGIMKQLWPKVFIIIEGEKMKALFDNLNI